MARNTKKSGYLHMQEKWKEMYESGLSFTKIGKEHSVHYTTVQTVLKGIVQPRPKKKFAQFAKEWAELYLDKEWSINQIAEQYNTDPTTISKYLKEEGIEMRRQYGQSSPYESYIPEWVQKYEQGMSLKEIADAYGIFPQTVHKWIKDKISMREYTETSKQYRIEHPGYLEKINTHEKAYWLGIWYGTGFVSKSIGGYECSLVVASKDVDTLKRFNKAIGYEKPIEITEEGNRHVAKLRINNKTFFDILLSHGLTSNKLEEMKIPQTLPSAFYNSFVLGYYEGKGSCGNHTGLIKGKGYTNTVFSLFGNKQFLQSLKNMIAEQTGVTLNSGSNKQYSNEVFFLRTGSKINVEKIAEWLYRDIKEFSSHRDIRKILMADVKTNTKHTVADR